MKLRAAFLRWKLSRIRENMINPERPCMWTWQRMLEKTKEEPMTDYLVYDLREIARGLGAHYSQMAEEDHFVWCDECGARIDQSMAECPGCGVKVVWKNSRKWRDIHGSPTARIRKYRAVMPEDEAGKYLMKRARQPGFKSLSEAGEWEELVNVLDQEELLEIVENCARKTRGRGLIKYALNAANKRAESLPSPWEDSGWETL